MKGLSSALLLLVATTWMLPGGKSAAQEGDVEKHETRDTRGGQGLRVFTCGHSFHTFVAPALRELAIAAQLRGHTIAGRSGIGGSKVIQHWDVPDSENLAKQKLIAGEVDVLTLSPIWLPDDGIDQFAELAVKHNANVLVTVQKFWLPNDEFHPVYPLQTRKVVDHNATQLDALQTAQDEYDRGVDEYVDGINQRLNTRAIVTVPIGQAVVALRRRIAAGECPGIVQQSELFRDSWGHPTPPIIALSGFCHFAVIYKRSPVGLPRPTILSSNAAWQNDELIRLLQEIAWEAVIKNPASGLTAESPK